MNSSGSTLAKDSKKGRTGVHSLGGPLETPFTIREKRRAFRRHLNGKLRILRKITRKALKGQPFLSLPLDKGVDVEPLRFGQRVVFRLVRFSIRSFLGIHAIYKKDSADATSILKATKHPHIAWYALDRSAIRAEFEEHQKITTQMSRLFPPDLDHNRPAQELCEQISEVHGTPSDVETELLGEIGNVGHEAIDTWFRTKAIRMKAHRAATVCRRHLLASVRKNSSRKLPKSSGSTDSGSKLRRSQDSQRLDVKNPQGQKWLR